MPGVRIRHATLHSCLVLVPDLSRSLRKPYQCPTCNTVHACKTYHLNLDSDGTVIVSPEIWERLKRIQNHDFSLENEVRKPPPQVVGLNPDSALIIKTVPGKRGNSDGEKRR